MNEQHFAQFELQLERLVEGAFAQIFGRRVQAHEIALQLARAMDEGVSATLSTDHRALAPDSYTISLNPLEQRWLMQRQPHLAEECARHLMDLAVNSGYALLVTPIVEIVAREDVPKGTVRVEAQHRTRKNSTTSAMKPVSLEGVANAPRNPRLILNGQAHIPLLQPIINVGRGHDNQIVLDDPSVSRHHLQLRLRFGRFVLFDTQSSAGTYVNQARVREHTLQTGDVVEVGKTRMVYVEDQQWAETHIDAPRVEGE